MVVLICECGSRPQDVTVDGTVTCNRCKAPLSGPVALRIVPEGNGNRRPQGLIAPRAVVLHVTLPVAVPPTKVEAQSPGLLND